MNKNLIRLAAIAALAVGAQADIIKTGIAPAGFVVGGASTGGYLGSLFPGGDITYNIPVTLATSAEVTGHGGVLIGVYYEIITGTYARFSLTDTAVYTIGWGIGAGGVTGTDPWANAINFGANDIEFGNFPGVVVNSTTTQNTSSSGHVNLPAPFATYVDGSVNFVFSADTFASIGGGATAQQQPDVFQGAEVRITYKFSEIPEPSTYAAGAVLLAGAGFIARRRMKAA